MSTEVAVKRTLLFLLCSTQGRTVCCTQCWNCFWGCRKMRRTWAPLSPRDQLPPWNREKVMMLPCTQEPSVTCAEVAETKKLVICSKVSAGQ